MSTPATPIAQGQSTRLSFVDETTMGATPGSPSMTLWRSLKRNINLKKATQVSEEIRTDGQVGYLRHGMNSVEGSIEMELANASYDLQIAAMMGSTWDAVTTAGTPNLAAAASINTYTRATGNFITDGYRAGDIITVAGFANAANNGSHVVITVTSTTLVVVETLVTESSAGSRTIVMTGKRVSAGTSINTLTIERAFSDLTKYQQFLGCTLNSGEFIINPESIVKFNAGIIGMSSGAMVGSSLGTPSETGMTTQPIAAFEGSIYEGGALNAVVTACNLNLARNRQLSGVVGSKYSPQIFAGTFVITGTLSAFFLDDTMFNKFVNETISRLYLKCLDPAGNFLHFVMNSLKYTGNDIDPPANGGVVQDMPFQAIVDTTTLTSLSIQRSNT